METVFDDLALRGYAVIAEALTASEIAALGEGLARLSPTEGVVPRAGLRDLFNRLPAIRDLARHPAIAGWPRAVLGPGAFAVRALYFDKTPDSNWKVAWHQDLTIPTLARAEVSGFGPWSEKAGAPHVQPPAGVLEGMLTVRVHLDDCGLDNGPVRVLPGSHRLGKVSPDAVEDLRGSIREVAVTVPAGGLMLMRPLLLHASSPSTGPSHRRVIHLEFAASELPAGLQWRERWAPAGARPRTALSRLGRRMATV